MEKVKYWWNFLLALCWCEVFRCMPGRFANVEPIMALLMPASRIYGKIGGLIFGSGAIVLYDVITWSWGWWTVIDATAYGMVGVLFSIVLQNGHLSLGRYLQCAVVGVLFYDGVTGLVCGPLCFGQSLQDAFVGQIPFTIMHLCGVIVWTCAVSKGAEYVMGHKKVLGEWGIVASSGR